MLYANFTYLVLRQQPDKSHEQVKLLQNTAHVKILCNESRYSKLILADRHIKRLLDHYIFLSSMIIFGAKKSTYFE